MRSRAVIPDRLPEFQPCKKRNQYRSGNQCKHKSGHKHRYLYRNPRLYIQSNPPLVFLQQLFILFCSNAVLLLIVSNHTLPVNLLTISSIFIPREPFTRITSPGLTSFIIYSAAAELLSKELRFVSGMPTARAPSII